MHVCFHGGGGGVAKAIGAIRGFAGSVKAVSLRAKAGEGDGGDRARPRRRWRRPPEADRKDVAASAAGGSASAKIAPARLQDEGEDGHREEEEEEDDDEEMRRGGGGKRGEYCDKCCSPLFDEDGGANGEASAAAEEESGRGEWVAEPEPGVVMTLAARPDGTNRLRVIRFREALFDAWAAQSWWADNYDRVVELYSVVQSDGDADDAVTSAAAPLTPYQSEEEEEELPDGDEAGAESAASPSTSNFSGGPSSGGSGSSGAVGVGSPILGLVVTDPNTISNTTAATTTTKKPDAVVEDENPAAAAAWREWVEEYEPGVFVTVRAHPDRRLQLRRIELSRERFGEVKARVWWQENKAKLQHLYSS